MGMSSLLGIFVLSIFISSVRACDYDCAYGAIYGISIGVTALIAIIVALCCVFCECCPLYRHRRRNNPVFMAQPQFMQANIGPSGITVGNGYGYAYNPNAPYPTQTIAPIPGAPPPYFSHQEGAGIVKGTSGAPQFLQQPQGQVPPYPAAEPAPRF